jgi:DNA-binding HxlR family transcriptional regulator
MECMKLVGGAWTPNVLWYLSAGPRRFGELRVDIEGISAKVLTARLRDLEQKAVVTRRVLPTSPPSVEYSLTPLGRELLPVIRAIVAVGEKLKNAPATPARASKQRRSGQARTSRAVRGEDGAR